jgi:hypothetical protein
MRGAMIKAFGEPSEGLWQINNFTCRHDQQSVVDLAIVARESYSNRTVANFLP